MIFSDGRKDELTKAREPFQKATLKSISEKGHLDHVNTFGNSRVDQNKSYELHKGRAIDRPESPTIARVTTILYRNYLDLFDTLAYII